MAAGYLYVLKNSSYKSCIVKIGRTIRMPSKRATELFQGSTGVPEPFSVYAWASVGDCIAAERRAHARLSAYRVYKKREFFELRPDVAVEVVCEICAAINLGLGMGAPEINVRENERKIKRLSSVPSKKMSEDAVMISVTLDQIDERPVGTSTLSDSEIDRVRTIYSILKEVVREERQEWCESFTQDPVPQPEIALWERMARIYLSIEHSGTYSKKEKFLIFGIIVLRSLGPEEPIEHYLCKGLPIKTVRQVLAECRGDIGALPIELCESRAGDINM